MIAAAGVGAQRQGSFATGAGGFPPSPGTPGEGRGEGLPVNAPLGARGRPSPCPLPAYREREEAWAFLATGHGFGASCATMHLTPLRRTITALAVIFMLTTFANAQEAPRGDTPDQARRPRLVRGGPASAPSS